jgi:hypothetical protein
MVKPKKAPTTAPVVRARSQNVQPAPPPPAGQVALFYADTIFDIELGSLTSKLTFGVQVRGQSIPAFTMVIPTPMLLLLNADLARRFQDQRVAKEIKAHVERYLAGLGVPPP